jgi:hypothetical protein
MEDKSWIGAPMLKVSVEAWAEAVFETRRNAAAPAMIILDME